MLPTKFILRALSRPERDTSNIGVGISGLQGEDAEKFVSMMGSYSAFSGLQILDYSLMSNHFHLVCFVPKPRLLSVEEVLERIAARYPEEARRLRARQARLAEQPDGLGTVRPPAGQVPEANERSLDLY